MGAEIMRRDLEQLHSNLDRMYNVVIRIAEKALKSLREWRPVDLDEEVYLAESMMELIEERATLFIARYQPLGPELIEAKSVIRVSYDLYRISRYSREIASLVHHIGERVDVSRDILETGALVIEMIKSAYKAYREKDREEYEKVIAWDDSVDKVYIGMLSRLGEEHTIRREEVVGLLVTRHLERMADHAVYISILSKK